jgi:predicted pyridoxine 5'-phosphate oxidase superfamily flavin-nucleotide-binding protein
MRHRYLEIASTPSVKAARAQWGSAAHYARVDGSLDQAGPVVHDRLTAQEDAFIAGRDSFYIASVSETGWPYVQFRGGPAGFLRVLNERMLGYADFRGNRQYITTGNVARNDCISLFLMDYAHRQRLKIYGRITVADARDDLDLAAKLAVPDYPEKIERSVLISVEGFDWNCPRHITPRFTQDELAEVSAPAREAMKALRDENERLKHLLHADGQERKGP